ncbi:MAG: MGMT family protein [Bacillota bacterium]
MESRLYQKIYEIVAGIPHGSVATYGLVAALAGIPRGARIVARAMHNTPPYMDIPCHRVVRGDGALAPDYVFGGAGRQREILEGEGIIFKANGRIDMKRSSWKLFIEQFAGNNMIVL